MSVEKAVWLSSQSEQVLNEIRDGLTEGQKDFLERNFHDDQMIGRGGSKYKKYILSQAVEIGLLSLKRDYSIERDLTVDEQVPSVEPIHPNEKPLPMGEIIKDYLSGMGFVELGAKYKIAHSTAYRRIRKAGIQRR
jgi:hypothetical protein